MVEFKYHVNLIEVFSLSSDYSDEEIEILKSYEPLIYAGNINEPPLGMYYEETGQSLGLVVDYINALSIELGVNIVSKPMVWNEVLTSLENGDADLSDMVPSESREEIFTFSDPIYNINGAVLVPTKNQTIFNLEDLNHKTIGIQKADHAIDSIINKNLDVNFYYTDNLEDALSLLYEGKIDAVVGDEPVILYHLRELSDRGEYQIIDDYVYESYAALTSTKANEDLIHVINKAIFNLKRKGTLDQIHKKWMNISDTFYDDMAEEKLKLIFLVAVFFTTLVVGMILLWNRSLKYLVKEKTSELEFTRNELQITFDSMKDFIVVYDQSNRIKNINASLLTYINKRKDDVLDKPIEIIPVLKTFLETYAPEFNSLHEFKYDKKIFEVSHSSLEIESSQSSYGLFIIADITTEKIQNQKVIQANKMEAIGQLASGIAHEVRNPLGVIRNSTFILKDEYDKRDVLKNKALTAIDNSVSRASNIIDNLLKFSRLTDDKVDMVKLDVLLNDIMALFKKRLRENNIKLTTRCVDEIVIETKVESLRHILINIISNAIDSMPNGGQLSLQCEDHDDKIILKIGDNGHGITDERKAKIFDPFFTTKPVGKGTGLGLYIVYSELQKINGEISVDSEERVGTTFSISIGKEV
jgi:polar amino acid transport system substrate-binding protein